jgi:hypothetical protein
VAAGEKVPVPPQNRLRAHQQPESMKRLRRESVQQGREECPVGGGEPWAGVSELAFQDRDLVA